MHNIYTLMSTNCNIL